MALIKLPLLIERFCEISAQHQEVRSVDGGPVFKIIITLTFKTNSQAESPGGSCEFSHYSQIISCAEVKILMHLWSDDL